MRRWLSCFAVFLFLFVLLPRLWAQSLRITQVTLEGTVVNGATGAPIPEARVSLIPSADDDPITAKTDAAGHFAFSNLTPGARYAIRAERPGYMRRGESRNAVSAPEPLDLTVSAQAYHRYLAERAAAASNATSATPATPAAAPATSAPAAVRKSFNVPLSTTIEKRIDENGVMHASVTLGLVACGLITGKVTSPEGVPLSGPLVRLLQKVPLNPGQKYLPGQEIPGDPKSFLASVGGMVQTDDRGEFRIPRLPEGTYYLEVSGTVTRENWGSNYRTTFYGGATRVDGAKAIPMAPGQQTRAEIQVVSQRGVRVSGHILEPGPVPPTPPGTHTGTAVYRYGATAGGDESIQQSGSVLEDGSEYLMEDVPPGRYTLSAKCFQYTNESVLTGETRKLWGGARSVEVGASDLAGVDIEMTPPQDIPGTVVFATGCPRVPVQIRATTGFDAGGMRAPFKVDGEDGRFVLKNILPGPVHLAVEASGVSGARWLVSTPAGERELEFGRLDAPLPNGATLKLAVSCPQGGTGR
jgi:hypothetical protein